MILRVIIVVLAVAAALWMLYELRGIILLIILAIFFAYLIAPLVDLVCKPFKLIGRDFCVSRSLSIGIAYIIIFGLIALFIYLLLPQLGEQIAQLAQQAPSFYSSVRDRVQNLGGRYSLPPSVHETINRIATRSIEESGEFTRRVVLELIALLSYIPWLILVPILALGLPVIDTLLVMAVRFLEKPQGSLLRRFVRMFQADRNHVHHLMARAAPGRKQIVLVIYSVAACFCAMALVVAVSRSAALGTALVVVEVMVVFLMRNLGVRREARALSLKQRHQVREGFFGRA